MSEKRRRKTMDRWFTLVSCSHGGKDDGTATWLEGPFATEATAEEHALVVRHRRGYVYEASPIRLERVVNGTMRQGPLVAA